MVTYNGRLYRTDDYLLLKDAEAADACAVYDLDDTQPWHNEPVLVDPDMTKVLMDSAKAAGTKRQVWGALGRNKLMDVLTAVIIIGALLYGFLMGGI